MTDGDRSLAAIALAVALSSGSGCAFAVEHPAATAGIIGTTLGFGTCKLASDSYAACGLVGGGAGAFLALVAAAATWLGGDGHTVMVEEPPDDTAGPTAPAQPAPAPPLAPPAAPPARPAADRPAP